MTFHGKKINHSERKPNRLKGYDYSRYGMYFITMCVRDRIESFGNIHDGNMTLNKYGEIILQQWNWLGHQYNYIKPDAFVVMPNHVHGIICIADVPDADGILGENGFCETDRVGNGRDRSLPERSVPDIHHDTRRKIKPIPEIIGAFKTTSSKLIHLAGLESFRWQKSYYEQIIRDEASLRNIRRYIEENPARWDTDGENVEATG